MVAAAAEADAADAADAAAEHNEHGLRYYHGHRGWRSGGAAGGRGNCRGGETSNAGCGREIQPTADTVFGAIRALETFVQLVQLNMSIVTEQYIEDRPRFPFRGILIDTARPVVS